MPESAVLYATDANYWPHLYVSLYSLLKNNLERAFRVFIICNAPDETFQRNAELLPGNLSSLTIVNGNGLFTDAPLRKYFTPAAYYRLAAGRLLPDDVRDLLYLDCDTVVTANLGEILSFDLKEALLAAVDEQSKQAEFAQRLGIPSHAYFNSGVLRMNMAKWRSIDAGRQSIAFMNAHPDRIHCADQDILNALFYNNRITLLDRFNYQREDRDQKSDVAIIHYIGSRKPWTPGHIRSSHYWRYRQETPYAIGTARLQLLQFKAFAARQRKKLHSGAVVRFFGTAGNPKR